MKFFITILLLACFPFIAGAQEFSPEMIFVKGGKFKMGSNIGVQDEQPVHEVVLDDFYIGKFEVTQDQWKRIMDQDTSKRYFRNCGNCPVERVSWYNVMEFIEKLNRETGLHYRLPTEAEWEYAASGGNLSKGFKYSGSNLIDSVAWKDGNAGTSTHPVGQKAPNELGLFDMTGNVFEWCSDWYSDDYYQFREYENPAGPFYGTFKVMRGGSWFHDHTGLRINEREKGNPEFRYGYVGFRLCRSASDTVPTLKTTRETNIVQPGETEKSCNITYTGNEGFLVETMSKKIMVDALFGGIKGKWCDQPGDSISRMMISGTAPFDNIDIAFVSHRHSDHFNAALTIDFLKNNATTFLVCPNQVNDLLKMAEGYPDVLGRIIPINSDVHPDFYFSMNGIDIRAMRFRHGSWFETDSVSGKQVDLHEGVENIAYMVSLDGFTFFHSGDCSISDSAAFAKFKLSAKEMDFAFFDRVFLRPEGMKIIEKNIRTKNIVLMHIEPGRSDYYKSVLKEYPEFLIFSKLMEKKELKLKNIKP